MTTTHPPGAVAVFFKDNAVFLTGAVAVIITFATMQANVAQLEKDVGENKQQISERVEPLAKEVQAIRTEQAVMKKGFEGEQRVQKQYRDNMEKTMTRVETALEKLADNSE